MICSTLFAVRRFPVRRRTLESARSYLDRADCPAIERVLCCALMKCEPARSYPTFPGQLRRRLASALGLTPLLVACGDDGEAPPSMTGDASHIGSGGMVTLDGGPVGSGGSSGSAGTRGGNSTGGAGGDGAVGEPGDGGGNGEPDLSLGGLNQDLPLPGTDCLLAVEEPIVGCFSFSGDWDGRTVNHTCLENNGPAYAGTSGRERFIGCRAVVPPADDELLLYVRLSDELLGDPPNSFQFSLPPASEQAARVDLTDEARGYRTQLPSMFALSETHIQTVRVAGFTEHVPGRRDGTTSEVVRGTFAITVEPKPGCAATTGLACGTIRLRGTYHGRTIVEVL